jgi:tRNA threonylcarbamoyladenosine biosynthesis protein TsaB
LLRKHGFDKSNLGGFAVASGPGSFTGLRVGLAAVQGLSEVLHKPIAAVSLLEAVADGIEGRLFAVLDAGRGEVYAGEFDHGELTLFGEQLLTQEEFLAAPHATTVITRDHAFAEALGQVGGGVVVIDRPRSDVIARIGWRKIQAGKTVSPEELDANYIRRSDAEMAKGGS